MDDHGGVVVAASTRPSLSLLGKLKLFLALSRTPHAVFDLATPMLGALLALGGLPPIGIIALGLLTAFAGYTAVYALNDLVDYRVDREKIMRGGLSSDVEYLDAVGVRHPVARGLLTPREGVIWTGGWALAALGGAWLLNPVCAFIFLGSCLLEAVYCRLLNVSHLRVFVSGLVKTLGGIAAAFAVTRNPSPLFLALFFAWIFAWEIGGQNVPADLVDQEEDRGSGARTVPVRFGERGAAVIIIVSLAVATGLGAVVLAHAGGRLVPVWATASLLVGGWMLMVPAWKLGSFPKPAAVMGLFNRASLYPLAMLAVAMLKLGLGWER